MKKKLVFLAFSVCLLVFGIILVSCDDGNKNDRNKNDDIIPAKWRGTYGEGGDFTVTLHANGTISWTGEGIPNGSRSGVTIVNGGTASAPGGMKGDWVYIAADGLNQGIIINFTPAVDGYRWVLGLGNWGVSEILNLMNDYGATLSPPPNTSGIPSISIEGFSGGIWAAK